MIPTQPGIPAPTWPTQPNLFQKGWYCPSCGQYVGDMQYHACSGTNPFKDITTDTIESIGFNSSGVMSEVMMYADFKRLLKRDTLARFREIFLSAMLEAEGNTPLDSGDVSFGVDAVIDIFDNVATTFRDDNSV